MKILMFTPYVPYPPNSGGRTRTFNLIKNLSKKHEITSFSFLRTDHEEPDLSQLKKYCKKIEVFRRKKSFRSPKKILRTGLSRFPYLVNMYRYAEAKRAITDELAGNFYDLIHVETYYILPNIPQTNVPILLAEQTIEYLVYQHFAQTTNLWPIKPLLYIDVAKHKFWEKYYWQKAKKVVAMSQADKKKMLELVPDLDVDIVPNGIDIEFFSQRLKIKRDAHKTFLFQGNFSWLQNREAVAILVNDVWPIIRSKVPSARLWIVGREPTNEIKNLASSDIVISENIEDIRMAHQAADVLIAPLYGGGGTRYKVLEAMASGLPVVSTHIGVTGIGAQNNSHALISDDPKQLATLAVKIVHDNRLAKKIATNAYKLVVEKFDWVKISARLEEIYEETARKN